MKYEDYAKLRDLRKLKDYDVCKLTGIGSSTFSDWKHGRSTPKTDKLQKIASVLGVSYAEFIGIDEINNDNIPPLFHQEHLTVIALYEELTDEEKEIAIKTMTAFVRSHKCK